MIDLSAVTNRLAILVRMPLSGVPAGFDAMLLPEIARELARPLIHVALDDQRLAALAEQLKFFAPSLPVIRLPAWDCLPYDRVSRAADIVALRLATLSRLSRPIDGPIVIVTTVNAIQQRGVPRQLIEAATLSVAPGKRVSM